MTDVSTRDLQATHVDPLDITRADLWAEDRWQEPMRELRAQGPIVRNESSKFGPHWSVMHYKPIQHIEALPKLFSSSWEYGGVAVELQRQGGNAVDLDELIANMSGILDIIGDHADNLAGSINDLGTDLIATIGTSVNAMLVGLGGNAIGDVVEFLNAAYEPIKKGFQTGDWSDFGATVAQYGVAAALSAVLVIGSVAVASFFAGPIAAAFVAAGFAAYGLYDAITNGVELLGKITTDLSDVADRIGETIETLGSAAEGYALILQRIIANAMDVDFGAPVFAGGAGGNALARRYLVDPLDNRLPGSVVGTSANERFYGQNNATIDARGGNDEVYLRNGGIALGGAGDDILAGRGGPRGTRGNSEFSGGGGDFGGGGASGSWEGPAGSIYTLTLDGGAGNDWVIATGAQASVTIGGLGRDWLYNTSVGGIIWGDIVNSVEAADGSRFVIEGGVRRAIADDASNADSFWFAPDVTIMDAQGVDRLRFFGLTLTGGDTTLTSAALAVGALSNPLFGAGVAGAAAAVNLNRFASGEPLVYFDRFVPWITYSARARASGGRGRAVAVEGAAPGTQDLIVGVSNDNECAFAAWEVA